MFEKLKLVLGITVEQEELSNLDVIKDAKQKVSTALSSFNYLKNELKGANESLSVVISKSEEDIKVAQDNIDSANIEIIANKELLEKIENFIG